MRNIHKNIIIGILMFLLVFVLIAATVDVKTDGTVKIGSLTVAPSGTVSVSGHMSASSYDGWGIVPIGTIVGWHRNLHPNVGALPDGWVPCEGQILNDPASVLNGVLIPNLNGNPAGANSPHLGHKARMFLRGGTESGLAQDHAVQSHSHSFAYEKNHHVRVASGGGSTIADSSYHAVGGSTTGQTGYTAEETRPVNMTVIWIMRVK